MSEWMEARPTEYDGIIFKSKSEAVIARGFDLAGILWRYEPLNFKTKDGWIPDFWIILPPREKGKCFSSWIVEYKPCKPTETYLEKLKGRFLSIKHTTYGHYEVVLYGSPFDDTKPRGGLYLYETESGIKWENPGGSWSRFTDHWEEALKYRFDLGGE